MYQMNQIFHVILRYGLTTYDISTYGIFLKTTSPEVRARYNKVK